MGHPTITDNQDITELTQRLYNAAIEYYQGSGNTGMTDDEYDAGIQYLRSAVESGLTQDPKVLDLIDGKVAGGTTIKTHTNTVRHTIPMLSLAKANNRDEVEAYVKKMIINGATGFKLQAKFDGIACSAVYTHGQLTQMSTRGDGANGEDMSYLINNPHVTIKGLPNTLAGNAQQASVEIRGELFLRPSEFKTLNEHRKAQGLPPFSNPRNTNAGIVKKAANDDVDDVNLQFVMYKIIGDVSETDLEHSGVATASKLTEIEWTATELPIPGGTLTVTIPNNNHDNTSITDHVMAIVDAFDPVRAQTDLSLDGIVIKPLNENAMDDLMGHTAHHPNSQLAFKYPGSTGTTTVIGVDVTIGKTGKITPTAILNPVIIDGVTITRATMHNYDWLKEKGIRIGSIVQVERRHDVIPAIKTVIQNPKNTKPITMPLACPYCGSTIIDGYCKNDECPSKDRFMLQAAASKNVLNLDGLGPKIIDALQSNGIIHDIADFYTLTVKDLANAPLGDNADGTPRQFGMKRAEHVMSYIEKSKNLPLYKILAALSIPDLGVQTAKSIVKVYPSIDELRNATVKDVAQIDGIGMVTATRIIHGLELRWNVIERLREAGVQFDNNQNGTTTQPIEPTSPSGTENDNPRKALQGIRISITGKVPTGWDNRGQWQDYVDAMGGEAQTVPKANTDYLIWDGEKTSSKLIKARKNGVNIISPDDFITGIHNGALPDHSTYDEHGAYIG